MIFTLIGMSGTGKSHWSKQIADLGFERIDTDDLIEQKIGPELTTHGYQGLADVTKWMGLPHDERYPRTSQTYLDYESQITLETLAALDALPAGANQVIDTSGSVILLPQPILSELARKSTMVYFHTPVSAHAKMAEQFLADPKPLLWGDSYNPQPGETPAEAIARCYPQLLTDRTAKYQKLAHVTFDYHELRGGEMTAHDIINRAAEYSEAVHV